MREYVFFVLVAATVTYAAAPLLLRLALRWKAFTPVRDRDVHTVPIPRLGGVAMFLGFGAAMLVASRLPFSRQMFASDELRGVFLGAAIVCLIGAIDDIREMDWLVKLGGQVLAAGVMAFHGVQLISLPLGARWVLPAPVLVTLTIVVVVVSTNAVNFVDGLDGLATGIVGIAAVAFFAYTYVIARTFSPPNVFTSAAFIGAALLGCCLGFLPHNIHPARLFMGDSGALLLGLLLAAAMISVTGTTNAAELSTNAVVATLAPLLVPVAIILLPLADVLFAVVRRTRKGLRPWQPDAGHLHHRMLQWGHGHRRAVALLWGWAATAALGSVSFVFVHPALAAGGFSLMASVMAALTIWRPKEGERGAPREAAFVMLRSGVLWGAVLGGVALVTLAVLRWSSDGSAGLVDVLVAGLLALVVVAVCFAGGVLGLRAVMRSTPGLSLVAALVIYTAQLLLLAALLVVLRASEVVEPVAFAIVAVAATLGWQVGLVRGMVTARIPIGRGPREQ